MFAKYQINPQKIAKEFLNIAEVAKFWQISPHTDSDLLKVWASLRRLFSFCHYLADNLYFKVVQNLSDLNPNKSIINNLISKKFTINTKFRSDTTFNLFHLDLDSNEDLLYYLVTY